MGNTRAPMMITMQYFEMLFCIKAKVLNVQELSTPFVLCAFGNIFILKEALRRYFLGIFPR